MNGRAGAAVIPPLDPTPEQKELVTNSFKYYWKLAERDPSSGVKVCSCYLLFLFIPSIRSFLHSSFHSIPFVHSTRSPSKSPIPLP
jgi:hypothetical protein